MNNTPKCPKCDSTIIEITRVDGRKMYECQGCSNVWYEKRTVTGAYEVVVDEITEGVEKDGSFTTDAVLLLNTAFRPSPDDKVSFDKKISVWAEQNKLQHNIRGEKIEFFR